MINGLNKIPKVNIPTIPQIPSFSQQTTTGKPPLKAQAVPPLKAAGAKAAPVTNNFAAAHINISGVTDTKAVGLLVDQKLQQHQWAQAAAQRRSFSDIG